MKKRYKGRDFCHRFLHLSYHKNTCHCNYFPFLEHCDTIIEAGETVEHCLAGHYIPVRELQYLHFDHGFWKFYIPLQFLKNKIRCVCIDNMYFFRLALIKWYDVRLMPSINSMINLIIGQLVLPIIKGMVIIILKYTIGIFVVVILHMSHIYMDV